MKSFSGMVMIACVAALALTLATMAAPASEQDVRISDGSLYLPSTYFDSYGNPIIQFSESVRQDEINQQQHLVIDEEDLSQTYTENVDQSSNQSVQN